MIQFRFAPPLDNYAGEVKGGKGEINFKRADRLKGASGFIEIDTRTAITMGNAVLDEVNCLFRCPFSQFNGVYEKNRSYHQQP